MSNCYDAAKIVGCFIPDDGSPKESILVHTIYNSNGMPHETFVTSLDSDVKLDPATYLGGGNIVIGECSCIETAQFKCLKKRNFTLSYDNGFTPGSSTNDGGLRPDFVRFSWDFEVVGWETNLGTLGAGDPLVGYTNWTPQLQGWVAFGNTHYPNVNHDFAFVPAPTWRSWVITGCDPIAQFGVWTIRRDDGVVFDLYPVNVSENYEYVWCIDTIDCDGNPSQVFYDRSQDDVTNVITWTEIPTPADINCFVNCDRELPPVVIPGAESECVTKEYQACDGAVDPQEELIIFTFDCPDQDRVTIAHLLSDWTANETAADPVPEVPEYDLTNAELVDCVTGDPVVLPEPLNENEIISECVESQEWTYGLDNTGTSFAEDNTIEITLSDSTTFTFNQPPAANWTPQMAIWGDEIQAAADAAGLQWFVETRYRNPSNPSSLAGGGGFSGPPSVPVSLALTSMLYRYVNIQICPGQPVPVGAVIIDSSNPARIGYNLTTNGAVKGPKQRFFICRQCGSEPVWYLDDGVTLAEAGQIPDCYEPCGVLSQLPSPPENDCSFQTVIGCDNNNSDLTTDFTPDITRRAQVCNGEQIAVDYFQADPNDPNALIDYTLNGVFVDCATGEPVPLPEPPCFEYNTVQCPDYEIYPAPITDGGRDITQEENDLFPNSGIGDARNFTPWLSQYIDVPPFPITNFTDPAPASDITGGFNDGADNIFRTRVFDFGLDDSDVPQCADGSPPDEVELNLNLQITGNHTVAGIGDDIFIYILDGPSTTPVLLDTLALVGAPLLGTNIYSLSTTVSPASLNDLRFALSLQTIESGTRIFNWDVSVFEIGVTIPGCELSCVRYVHDQCAANQRKSSNDLLYQIAQNTRPEPEEECSDFELMKVWRLSSPADGQLRKRAWHDTAPVISIADSSTETGREFRESHDFSSTPDNDVFVTNLQLNDIDNTAGELDVEVHEGWVQVTELMMLRYSGASEGYWAVELGKCCGDLKLLGESGGSSPTRELLFELPVGIHKIRIWNIDSGGTNSSANLSVSTDGGITYTTDNSPSEINLSSTPIVEECLQVKVCNDSDEIINVLTNEAVDPLEVTTCPQKCEVSDSSLDVVELCDGSKGIKVEVACCSNLVPTRFGRTYNSDNNVLSGEGFHTASGYDSLASDFGCTPNADRKIWFQGAVYVDGKAYPYATEALTIPATELQAKNHLIAAMNQAVAGTGVSFRYFNNGFIEMRGPDVDMAYSVQKGLYDDNGDICWDTQYFIYRDDVDGTVQGDSISSPVSNPYDPLALPQLQGGATGNI